MAATNFGPIGTGKVYLNGPFALTTYFGQLTMFGTFVISAIFGTAALRDFQENTYPLLFTRPISKGAYLGGRWAGSVLICVGIFLSIGLGAFTGTLMPWVDPERLAPFRLWYYLQPFLSITVIQIVFLGSVFFAVGALTRRLMIVYLQGVILFGIYLMVSIWVLSQELDTFWPSVVDPLGMVLSNSITKYWSVADRNTRLLPWEGELLYNRLLWLFVGALALGWTFIRFPMGAGETRFAWRRRLIQQAADEEDTSARGPARLRHKTVCPELGRAALLRKLWSLTSMRFANIVREVPFWAIVLLMFVITTINGLNAGQIIGTPVWPVTWVMLTAIQGGSMLLLFTIATIYIGEVVWRERDVRLDQIPDALPYPTWLNAVSQLAAITLVHIILLLAVMVCGIALQAWSGYLRFELAQYIRQLFLITFPVLLMFNFFCLFTHTILGNKFLAHAVVVGTFVITPILYRYGIESRMILIGETVPYTYSDMNGYGHFVKGLAASLLYWLGFGLISVVAALAFARRGTDLDWKSRVKAARSRVHSLLPAGAVAVAVFLAAGTWFYYNAYVLNEFRTIAAMRHERAAYERTYKKHQRLPQPMITAVEANVDIFPERRSIAAQGHYSVVNRTAAPLTEIHFTTDREVFSEITFDRPSAVQLQDKRLGYHVYRLQEPLPPNAAMEVRFRVAYESRGFKDGGERTELAHNGTFFGASYFPRIGYQPDVELSDPTRRKELGMRPQEELAPPGDPHYRNVNLFTPGSEWITYKTVVSTSPDQIAIAPGYLKREWKQNGRRYFEYDMEGTKINNFYAYVSGRYAVRKEQHKGVALEIYYHPGHEYNLDRMLQSARRGLDYFGQNFSPYQFRQFRVIEFPRYRSFAQSFPNTIPFSEGLGFIQRVEKPDDIDGIFYLTAHELAHQWWGHQLIGSRTQGSNMMSESLAQYSALMIMEKEYGPNQIRKFLKYELDRYLRGRGAERRREPPLTLVQNEPYVWYNKGSLAMYAMRDYIGEQKLNAALREFLLANRYATGPYPDTRGFVAALRRVTPPDLQHVVTELFERIILFDNKAATATFTQLPDKKYKVEVTVESHKLQSDGLGAETEVPIKDLVDIGIFVGPKNKEQPLYMGKHWITGPRTKLEFVVDRRPERAGIDPYNKLIDRKPDDNVIAVSRM